MARHSGAVVVLVMMMMMVNWSNCMMSNKRIASTTAGNSTAAASSAWCNGHIIQGQCIIVADAASSGGEYLDFNLDVMEMVAMEYYDSGSRRVLVTKKGKMGYLALNPGISTYDKQQGKIGRVPNKGQSSRCTVYDRSCPK